MSPLWSGGSVSVLCSSSVNRNGFSFCVHWGCGSLLACGAGRYRQTAQGPCGCLTPPGLAAMVEPITGLYRALHGDDGDFHSLEYTEKPTWRCKGCV